MCTSGFLFDLRVGPLGADRELFTLRVCAWWTKSGSGSWCQLPRAPVSVPPGSNTSLFLRAGPGLGPTVGTWHWKAAGHLRGPLGTVRALLPPSPPLPPPPAISWLQVPSRERKRRKRNRRDAVSQRPGARMELHRVVLQALAAGCRFHNFMA